KPFDLPKTWLAAKAKVNRAAPFNFVLTADIIGGNSGSPVVNKAGEFVGIIFDMNLPSLVFNFAFREHDARSMAVHSRGILEVLRNVYGASEVVAELARK
ncbi:MAG TPA: S46 family peptidase, partial [Thermoanaerobaculia bacterium]